MKDFTTYLTFAGNCREAMTFYQTCLDAELSLSPFSETDPGIMHARLAKGSAVIMASDTMPGKPVHQGNNFSIAISCDSANDLDTLFSALKENGTVTMPPQDTFWGAYFGMLTDQFGINWMFNFDKPHQA